MALCTKADLYALEWLEAAAARLPWLTVVPVLSDAKPEDAWTGRTGFVHLAVLADFADLSQHEVYACGALIVIESAKRDFSARPACRKPASRRLLHLGSRQGRRLSAARQKAGTTRAASERQRACPSPDRPFVVR